jgi:hypothetical protein
VGNPQFPSRAQIENLQKAAALPASQEQAIKNGELRLTLQPHTLALIEIEK